MSRSSVAHMKPLVRRRVRASNMQPSSVISKIVSVASPRMTRTAQASRGKRDTEWFRCYNGEVMADRQRSGKPRVDWDTRKLEQGNQAATPAKLPSDTPPATPRKLTAEEQMALYEKELKEEDWG